MHKLEHCDGNLLVLTMAGTVSQDDYEQLVPRLESEMDVHDEIRLVCDVTEMESVTPPAIWEDVKFDLRHRKDFGRVAVVGSRRWHDWVTQMFKPIAEGVVRTFDATERHRAMEWVSQT